MWSTFFEAGGWGMYPVMVIGLPFLASVILFVLRPERRFAAVVIAMGAATLGSGLLGTSVGIVNSLRYLPQVARAEQVEIAALGCSESLHNLVLALMIGVLGALLSAAGALRAALARPSATAAK